MDIFVYRENAEQVTENFTPAQIPELLRDERAMIWVNMEAPSAADDQAAA